MIQYRQYQRYMLDTLFKQLPFASLGELIAALIYTKVVSMETGIFIGNWLLFESLIIGFHLYVAMNTRIKAAIS